VLKALSNPVLNTAREGAATASLGNLGQRLPHVKILHLGHFIKSPIFLKRNKNQFYY